MGQHRLRRVAPEWSNTGARQRAGCERLSAYGRADSGANLSSPIANEIARLRFRHLHLVRRNSSSKKILGRVWALPIPKHHEGRL